MELNQNNQSTTLSLFQVKNNNGMSNIWEVAKQSQMKSANRLHFDGKNNTSKDIIENFTKGLERENIQYKSVEKSTINKNIEIKNSSQRLNAFPIKNSDILQQN
jgi:glycine cleavage system regulatory protein